MNTDRQRYYDDVPTPIGRLRLFADAGGALVHVDLPGSRRPHPLDGARRDPGPLAAARAQFAAYFDGELRAFDLPMKPVGTSFQQAVWAALCDIGYGITESYADLAGRIGRPRAVRAVGAANGANPLAIVVPCHRVIGADGSLTGYGGGLDAKRWLLAHEQRHAGPPPLVLQSPG